MDYAPPTSPHPQDYEIPPSKEKKPRGCFFYGCLISIILFILGVVALVALVFWLISTMNNFVKENTDTKPEPIPASAMPVAERNALKSRVDAYFEELKAGKADKPLVLTADDINALIEQNEDVKGTVHVDLEGDKVKGKVSYPLGNLEFTKSWPFKEWKGRYANGSATLLITLVDGFLVVRAEDVVIKGQALPENVAQQLKEQNLAKDIKDANVREFFSRMKSIEVKDGKFIITPKSMGAAKPGDETPKDETPKDEKAKDDMPKDEKPKEEPPKDETPKEKP